jgi:hypothetical protein
MKRFLRDYFYWRNVGFRPSVACAMAREGFPIESWDENQ